MANTNKKIPTLLFAIAVSASLLAGYFCFTPNIAQAVLNMPHMSYASDLSGQSNFSGCQDATTPDHYLLSSAEQTGALAPCCLEKQNNAQSGALASNNFSSDCFYSQLTSASQIVSDISSGPIISFDYPISPTQTGISSSIILIE